MGLMSLLKKEAEVAPAAPPAETPKAVGVVPPDAPVLHTFAMEKSTNVAWTCTCSASFNSQNGLAEHLQATAPAYPGRGEPPTPPSPAPQPPPQTAPEPAVTAPKKRGRPTLKAPTSPSEQAAEVKSPPSAVVPQAPAPMGIPSPAASDVQTTTPSSTPGPQGIGAYVQQLAGIRLFIGCIPVGAPTQSLAPYVETLQRQLLAAEAAAEGFSTDLDIRCAEGKNFGFGKWKGWLAGAVKMQPPAPGSYLITSGDERVDVVGETLAGILPAGAVVRGVR